MARQDGPGGAFGDSGRGEAPPEIVSHALALIAERAEILANDVETTPDSVRS